LNCVISGFEIGIALGGYGCCAFGNHVKQCGTGLHTNISYNRMPTYMSGLHIASNVFERCGTGLFINTVSVWAGGNAIIGDVGVPNSVPIQSMNWDVGSHLVTVTTQAAHNIPLGAGKILCLDSINHPTWTPGGACTERIIANVIDTTHFTYPGPAVAPQAFVGGYWNYPLGGNEIYLGSVSNVVIAANALASRVIGKSVYIAGEPEQIYQKDTICMAMRGPNGWTTPMDYQANLYGFGPNSFSPYWKFIQCGMAGNSAPAAPVNYMTWATLALGWWNYEGREYSITNAQTQNTFGAAIPGGGGSNHYKVRFDGTNWIRVG
jgi:hypothetical protein